MANDSQQLETAPKTTQNQPMDNQAEASGSTDQHGPKAAVEQQKTGEKNHLARILSMKVPVIVRIAQKKISLNEVLKFQLGSVIQFDQDAYEQIDLMVNNSIIGLGQAVKLGENFGLKITQIAEVTETIKSLGGKTK